MRSPTPCVIRFNEAGAIEPRKHPASGLAMAWRRPRFNEAGAIEPRKQGERIAEV